MQQQWTCPNCGTEMSAEARFCRRCGLPLSATNPGSVTEATTRLLQTEERPPAPRIDFNERPGGPLVQPGNETQPLSGTSTNALAKPKPQHNWALTTALLVLILGLIIAVVVLKSRSPTVTIISPPTTSVPVEPPAPPQPPGLPSGEATSGTGISSDLVYPGSKVTMQINGNHGKNLLQLQTSDSVSEVADWYTTKLKLTKTIMSSSSNVILEAGSMKIILTQTGNGTNILLAQGED